MKAEGEWGGQVGKPAVPCRFTDITKRSRWKFQLWKTASEWRGWKWWMVGLIQARGGENNWFTVQTQVLSTLRKILNSEFYLVLSPQQEDLRVAQTLNCGSFCLSVTHSVFSLNNKSAARHRWEDFHIFNAEFLRREGRSSLRGVHSLRLCRCETSCWYLTEL